MHGRLLKESPFRDRMQIIQMLESGSQGPTKRLFCLTQDSQVGQGWVEEAASGLERSGVDIGGMNEGKGIDSPI